MGRLGETTDDGGKAKALQVLGGRKDAVGKGSEERGIKEKRGRQDYR